MALFFAAPDFARQGVVAGFVLSAPNTSGTPGTPYPGAVVFQFYNDSITIGSYRLTITSPGYEHFITIAGSTYAYVQQSPGGTPDTVATIVTELANAINSAPDPYAVATANTGSGTITLTPRLDTGAVIYCSASDANNLFNLSQLVELTGNNLIPSITKGVLFAQGTMYAPSTPPTLAAAAASAKRYLYYSSTSGWYWSASSSPTVSDDACVGWAVTNATEVIAVSSSRLGTGEAEALISPAAPVLLGEPLLGDTGVTGTPTFAVGTDEQGRLILTNVAFPSDANVAGVFSTTWVLFYIDLMAAVPATLAAAMLAGDTRLSASAALPAASPTLVVFTFSSTTIGLLTIGPGYVHNIVIGSTPYGYVQQTGDTAAVIAANLAAVINAADDLNATATAVGGTVTLSPVQNTGATVACTASDGNSPQTLTELFPSFVMIDSELIQVNATNGSSITRAALGSTAAAHASGAPIYVIQTMTQYFALDGSLIDTNSWPSVVGTVPFAQKALEAVQMWATNEFGDSTTASFCYSEAAIYSGFPGIISLSPLRTITAATTISPSDVVLGVDTSGGGISQALPASSGMRAPFTIKKTSADANTLTLTPSAGELIDGSSSPITLSSVGASVTLAPLKSGGYHLIGSGGSIDANLDLQNPLTYNPSCGDGVTDATSAVVSAIACGGLHLPSGSIFLTAPIVLSGLPDGFTIYGGGRLKLAAGAGAPLLSIGSMNDVRVADCRFDGNSATGSGNAVIALTGVTECSLHGLRIIGGQGAGISLSGCGTVRISDCNAAAQTPGLAVSTSTWMSAMNVGIPDQEYF